MKKSRFTDSQTCYRYTPTLSDEHERIADWLVLLTHNQPQRGIKSVLLVPAQRQAFRLESHPGRN